MRFWGDAFKPSFWLEWGIMSVSNAGGQAISLLIDLL
jgi:hypothetical protein